MTTKTLFLVDDDADDLMMLKDAIQSIDASYNFVESTDGLSALNYLKGLSEKEFPCLVILDINMPILDGREVLAIVKNDSRLKEIPVVIFTTSSNPADKAYCQKFEVDLITKPFDMPQLMSKAEVLLQYCSSRKSSQLN